MKKLILLFIAAASVLNAAPIFTNYEQINPKDGISSWIPSGLKCGSPSRVDWDNDGVLDILYGFMRTPSGNGMNIFINSGTNREPIYNDPITKSYPITGV